MLLLGFEIDELTFAIDAERVVEVLPFAQAEKIPEAPACIAGVIARAGKPLAVVDLAQLIAKRPSRDRLSTRIVIVNDTQSGAAVLGLIAERAGALSRPGETAGAPLSAAGAAPFLGPVFTTEAGLCRLINLDPIVALAARDWQALSALEVNEADARKDR